MSALVRFKLAQLNRLRFPTSRSDVDWRSSLDEESELHRVEVAWIEGKRATVCATARAAPRDATGFLAWLEALEAHPLIAWLATEATPAQARWIRDQEVAADTGFDDLGTEISIRGGRGMRGPSSTIDEAIDLGHLLVGLAANRRYAYQAFGALGVAPRRDTASWNREVLAPLVDRDASIAPLVAEGALMRLAATAACFDRYRHDLADHAVAA